MVRPRLNTALTWQKYEQAVLAVFAEALRRLAGRSTLPQGEEPINLELFWICREVHFEQMQAKQSIPFFILFDSTNQPEPDDTADSRRLKKRPDFGCALTDEQAPDARSSQLIYWVECKRLGRAEASWALNANYSEHGMLRFTRAGHGYAKGCSSAPMIGYMQNMEPDDVLTEVNGHAAARSIPSLAKAATAWVEKDVTELSNQLMREFVADPLDVNHLWVDLRHCTFEKPQKVVATRRKAASKRKKHRKTTARKKRTRKTPSR